jgi:hypothetical protein
MDGSMEGVWRTQTEAAARFTEVWRELLEGSAGGASGSPASQLVQDHLAAITRSAADYAAVALGPIRDLVEGQRDFADRMTRWAELQRDLADNMASWAAQQREYADALDRLLAPFTPRPSGS